MCVQIFMLPAKGLLHSLSFLVTTVSPSQLIMNLFPADFHPNMVCMQCCGLLVCLF